MTDSEIESILAKHFHRRTTSDYVPSADDWFKFANYFDWNPPETFKSLMNVAPGFCFEGGLLRAASTNGIEGEDTIITVFEIERDIGGWDEDWIPFYAFGNGDYYALCKASGQVVTVLHENRQANPVCPNIDEWIIGLPDY